MENKLSKKASHSNKKHLSSSKLNTRNFFFRLQLIPAFILLTCILISLTQDVQADRRPSYPLITGDGFRDSSDFIYDETDKSFNPNAVASGDIIFVKTDFIGEFFRNIHPQISHPYVLITHNSDYPAPGSCRKFLDDPKILAWFAQNAEGYIHKKLIPIPIGLENRYCYHGNPNIVLDAIKKLSYSPKKIALYLNISIWTCVRERSLVYNMFSKDPYCYTSSNKQYQDYLQDLSESFFVLCPRGNGLDCHRTWESLYMGAIPIVKSSAMDAAFDDLPVLIIKDWSEVTKEFLLNKYEEMSQKTFKNERLLMNYWINYINQYRPPKVAEDLFENM